MEKTITPAIKRNLTELAKLKREQKKLKAKVDAKQKLIFKSCEEIGIDPPKRFDLRGKEFLSLSKRDNWSCPTNDAVLEIIGKTAFLKHAKMTKATVEAAGGTAAIDKLKAKGELEITSTTKSYSLK